MGATFMDLYKLTGETLGEGSYGRVETCKNVFSGMEYAVKIIEKRPGSFSRSKVLKEIEIYHLCRGQRNIIQLIEFFEEAGNFYLVFEKINGGPLLKHIERRKCFNEAEASLIIKILRKPSVIFTTKALLTETSSQTMFSVSITTLHFQ